MPSKRADGKEQINSWVDSQLAADLRGIQSELGLQHISDVVKHLIEIGVKNYEHTNTAPVCQNRDGIKKPNRSAGKN